MSNTSNIETMNNSTKTRKPSTKNSNAVSNGESATDKALSQFSEMMIQKIESIQSDWSKPWFTEGSSNSLPMNLSGRHYNGMNSVMLLLLCEQKGYKLPIFVTFDRVTALNYNQSSVGRVPAVDADGNKRPLVSINKGEKSFPVFITTFTVVDALGNKIKYDDYKLLTEEQRKDYKVFPKLQVYRVFNIQQTNLEEARPEIYAKLVAENVTAKPEHSGEMFSFEPLDRMIAEQKWICPIELKHGDDCYYSLSRKVVVCPEKEQFKDGESFVNNVCHEMAHSTTIITDRIKPGASFGSKDYATEELTAELTAALVCQNYGIVKHIKDDSAAYLKSWLRSLKEDASFIKTVLLDIKRASSIILNKLDELSTKAADAA